MCTKILLQPANTCLFTNWFTIYPIKHIGHSDSFRSKMASRSGQREQRGSRKVESDEQEDDLTKVEYETSEGVEVIPTFDNIGLREDLLRGIYAYGL